MSVLAAAWLTVNLFDRSFPTRRSSDLLTTLTRAPEPAWVRVSACEARTPFVKAALWAQPAEQVLLELTSTVQALAFVALSSRLQKTSKARTLTLKGLPAVWSPSGLPAV